MTIRVPRPTSYRSRPARTFRHGRHHHGEFLMTGHYAAAWICGLLVVGWVSRDLAGASLQPHVVVRAALVVSLVLAAAACSLRCTAGATSGQLR